MGKIKTVIVDDEPRIRKGIERLVRSNGEDWEVIGAFSDGQEAYDAIVNTFKSIDLLITDVQMPIMNGLTLIKKLNSESNDFFSIIISGFDDFKYAQEAIREGATDYILKPIDREKFQLQLNEVKEKIIQKQKEKDRLRDIQEKASQLFYTKQIQFLSELTWNDETDISLMEWDFQFPKGRYLFAHIDIDQVFAKSKGISASERRAWHFAVENIIKESIANDLSNQGIDSWVWKNDNLSFWLLLYDQELIRVNPSFSSLVEEYLAKLKMIIRKYLKFTASIAIGNEFEDLSLLPTMREQLLSLIQFRMIKGNHVIFRLSTLNELSIEKSSTMSSSVYKYTEQIMNALDEKSEAEISKALSHFFREIESLKSPLLIQESIQYLCIRSINHLVENDRFSVDIKMFIETFQMTKKAANFIQLKDEIKNWMIRLVNKMKEIDSGQTDPIHQVKTWIHHHLSENITIKKMADNVYLNPTYLCEIFKVQTGETILNYVTNARLKKAKELLEKTDMKIYDIATNVGYQDTKYFSRLFKQWTNQSPSQYRERNYKQQVLQEK
ncbi:response regulator [Metabacillus sediminilitoris]|uniref:Response regulator n=1 Tax=Metabacillus sediminilitoris TaxID=2567941 RepID=A0A4S4BVR8_9BACI|nr:response regulator [Metabacillus sediminilitoris]QGQ44888.1 response regulator [Metabacillus sediminilitoris]THF78521.1 response regulator [Metabacillus sediminilitoris]